jgi:predicted enzyme related to lactoylglutathione lyase
VNISTAGPTIVTSKAKDALPFYATHFGLTPDDYGAGDESWYWTFTFGEHSELSFMLPQHGEPDFTGQGLFFYVELADDAEVDALRQRMIAGGVQVSEPKEEDSMYQCWLTDPVGLRVMVFTALT